MTARTFVSLLAPGIAAGNPIRFFSASLKVRNDAITGAD